MGLNDGFEGSVGFPSYSRIACLRSVVSFLVHVCMQGCMQQNKLYFVLVTEAFMMKLWS